MLALQVCAQVKHELNAYLLKGGYKALEAGFLETEIGWSHTRHIRALMSGGERRNEPLCGSSWEARDLTSMLLFLIIYLFIHSFIHLCTL